jgi:uncharacterized membrane protein YdjX (TVP38/TMEM64 family)
VVREILRSQILHVIVGLCFVAFWLTRWVAALGGPVAVWERFGLVAPAVSVPFQAIVATTPFPSDVLCVANGTVYGFWLGALFSWIGWYLAAFIEFGIGRRARTELRVEEWLTRLPRRLQDLPIEHPLFLIGSRYVPWAGGHVSTLLPGATGVRVKRFAWCAAVAIAPPSLLLAAVGAGLLSI